MAYLQELEKQVVIRPTGRDLGLPDGAAYASYYPAWETQTPQYQTPNPYQVAQAGYRTNDFVYSLITKRAYAEAKGKFRVMFGEEEPEEQKNHPLTKLIKNPGKGMTENDFWAIKRIMQDIAGFAAFEIEYNRLGEPIRLWIMRPDFCSFIRGAQDPLKYIRYQPYGMPPQDIPIVDDDGRRRVLFFSNAAEDFDPINPQVKFFSPTMHALNQIKVDNSMTYFLADFVARGAKISGLLSVQQVIDDNISQDLKRRWRETYGGSSNWSEIAVLGLGSTYQQMQMTFRDMAFPEMDARTETRICNVFNIETIVADARAGLDVSSYNNKREAIRNWYNGWVQDTWDNNCEIIDQQMLPVYHADPAGYSSNIDVSKVYALQEDRNDRWKRAGEAYKGNWITKNQALIEAGLPPTDDGTGDDYYSSSQPQQPAFTQAQPALIAAAATGLPKEGDKSEEQILEEKHFRAFAKRRIAEGKSDDLYLYEFKHCSEFRADQLVRNALAGAVAENLDIILKV
jgi:HK97 family phage portal protein